MANRKRKHSSSGTMEKLLKEELLKAGVTEAAAEKLEGLEISESDCPAMLVKLEIDDERNRLIMKSFFSEREELELYPPECKVLNDPVHGHMEFHPLCMAVVDTPQFQRLRNLKQLGMAYYVYPGASHNRFEHSLGVGHLAGVLTKALKERQPELGITTRDILCVQIAGLCHDLGHGPFSHLFDGGFIPLVRPDRPTKWEHEQSSVDMFDYLYDENGLEGVFKKYGFTEVHRIFIKELILGKALMPADEKGQVTKRYGKEKGFLYETIANERNKVDVDKWDYFKRDCHHLGITATFDHNRFIRFARVIKVDEEWQICLRDKEVFNMYEMFQTRHALHRKAYQHKVVQTIDVMVIQALKLADEHIRIPGKNRKRCKMSACIEKKNIDALMNLTDHVFNEILTSTIRALEPARKILRNIQCRDLYKCLKESVPISNRTLIESSTSISLRDEILKEVNAVDVQEHKLRDRLFVQMAHLDFGDKSRNPIDRMRFYSKNNLDEAVPKDAKEISILLPHTHFKEMIVRVVHCLTWNEEEDEKCRALLEDGFEKWCKKNDLQPPQISISLRDEILKEVDAVDVQEHKLRDRLFVQMAHLDFGDRRDEAVPQDAKEIFNMRPDTRIKGMIVRVYLCPMWKGEEDENCRNLLEDSFAKWCEKNKLQPPQDTANIRDYPEKDFIPQEDYITPERPTGSARKQGTVTGIKQRLKFPEKNP